MAKDFTHLCFLADIRKKSIKELAKTLLSKTLMVKGDEFENIDESTISLTIKARLHRKKVLVILDDIDELKQLHALAGEPNWFGFGSQIIITTRNQDLLLKHNIDNSRIYEVELLKPDQADELLRLHAFRKKNVDPEYNDVINRTVKYADGIPLVLEVLGSHLGDHQTVKDWEATLDMYERKGPHKTVQDTLRVSYDIGLEKIQQQIFLDIACFYREYDLRNVIYMLGSSHSFPHPESCIKLLIQRSLLKIDEYSCIQMHDLIQDMGREIVREESTELGKRSRLWSKEDILQVLKTNTGTGGIQVIELNEYDVEVKWKGKALEKMVNLRKLSLRGPKFSCGPEFLPDSLRVLEWVNYPSLTLPNDFDPGNLVILKLPSSSLQTLEPPSIALHKNGHTLFILPGEKIPKWFHKKRHGDSISFLFRKKFPEIAVCVVYKVEGRGCCCLSFQFQILINGAHQIEVKHDTLEIESDHVYLFDLMHRGRKFGLNSEVLKEGSWNHAKIQCECEYGDILADYDTMSDDVAGFVKCIGVYAYNHESSKEDIQFEVEENVDLGASSEIEKDANWDKDEFSMFYSDSSREDDSTYNISMPLEYIRSDEDDFKVSDRTKKVLSLFWGSFGLGEEAKSEKHAMQGGDGRSSTIQIESDEEREKEKEMEKERAKGKRKVVMD